MPQFSSDWFTNALVNFDYIKNYLRKENPINDILEVGSHEGRSSCWMLENMLSDTGTMTCIDPFADRPVTAFAKDSIPEDRTIEQRFRSNTAEFKKPGQTLEVHVNLSFPALAQLIVDKRQYDFIYIDGSHNSDEVLADAVMCFGLLRPGGVMLFDDYLWEGSHATLGYLSYLGRCKQSIDAFVNMFYHRLQLGLVNYQLAIVKKELE
jgi:predicted O-methyltransferase YrrM